MSAARTSITQTVRVHPDGTKAVDVEEVFTDGSKQVTSTVYPPGIDPPPLQHETQLQVVEQPTVQYASPVQVQPLPESRQGPCGGRCCLIGVAVAFCCIWPLVWAYHVMFVVGPQ